MHCPNADVSGLAEKTAASITDRRLQMIFASVQQVNMKTCIRYAIQDMRSRGTVLLKIQPFGLIIDLILYIRSFERNKAYQESGGGDLTVLSSSSGKQLM